MSKIKKIISIIIVSMLMINMFTGCTGKNENKESSSQQSSSDNKKQSNESNSDEEPYKFKIFANVWPAEESEVTKLFFDRMEKENNVDIEWELPPSSNYKERLQIMMASGDIPEVVNFMGHENKLFLDGVKNGLFIPITEYLDQAPHLKKYTYDVTWDAVTHDEELYMIPRTSIVRYDGFAVREDWLENVGLTMPEDKKMTLDEFTEMLRRFTEEDPDQNGKNDTYGFSPDIPNNGYLEEVINGAFGLLGWQEYDGQYLDLKYSRKHDNYKKALEYTAMLWEKGYIHPDWPLYKGSANAEKVEQGQAGVKTAFAGHVQGLQDNAQKNHPEAKLTYLVGVKNEDGKVLEATTNNGIWGGWAISKTAKNPEKILQVFDWMLSDGAWDEVKYGAEGVTYNVENGEKIPTEKYSSESRWNGLFVRRNNDPSFFINLKIQGEAKKQLEGWLGEAMSSYVFSEDKKHRPATADDPKFIDANDNLREVVSKIIVGELDVDAYDKALDDWYKSGGEQYIQEMNDYINSMK